MQAFTPSGADKQYFGLWPPINTSSITITIENYNNDPCLNLLLSGCHSDNGKETLIYTNMMWCTYKLNM